MKLIFALAVMAATASSLRAQTTTESPFFCNTKALSPAARARHFDELGPTLRERRLSVRELPNGYAFEFSSDPATVALVAEWVAGERACCPFFDIAMTFERERGPFRLTLTGRDGTKGFIKVDAPDWIK